MVSYQVHRSVEYQDRRVSKLLGFEKKKGILQELLHKLKVQGLKAAVLISSAF